MTKGLWWGRPANPWPAAAILSNFHIEAVRESFLNNFAHNFSYFRPWRENSLFYLISIYNISLYTRDFSKMRE